jgi:hypothetical protein
VPLSPLQGCLPSVVDNLMKDYFDTSCFAPASTQLIWNIYSGAILFGNAYSSLGRSLIFKGAASLMQMPDQPENNLEDYLKKDSFSL